MADQLFQARTYKPGQQIEYTPVADVAAGDVIVIGSLVCYSCEDIEAGALGNLETAGAIQGVAANEAWTQGADVFWDADGNPYGGTAGSGCFTVVASGNVRAGYARKARGATEPTGVIQLTSTSRPNVLPVQTVAAAGTNQATAAALIEGFNLVTGPDDTKGVVLPAAAAGKQVIIKVGDGADLKVWPATGDAINALGANNSMTVVDDVCFTLIALDSTTWYTTPLLPS